MISDARSADVPAIIRNEVRVDKRLTRTHRHVEFRVGRRAGLDLPLWLYIQALCPRYPRDFTARWCGQGHITVDGVIANADQAVATGQLVILHVPLPPPDPGYTPPPLEVLWQDGRLAVLIKQPGHLAHQAGKIMTGTLINQLQDWALEHGLNADSIRLVNRIDRDTSGLVLASFDLEVHVAASTLITSRAVYKGYQAICHARPATDHGHWTDPIGGRREDSIVQMIRADGLACDTEFAVTAVAAVFSLLSITLHTGRQHQIRVHAAHHGCPLVGDWLYGTPCAELPGQALHAAELGFTHPLTGEPLRFTAPLPPKFSALWQHLAAGGDVTAIPLNDAQQQRREQG